MAAPPDQHPIPADEASATPADAALALVRRAAALGFDPHRVAQAIDRPELAARLVRDDPP